MLVYLFIATQISISPFPEDFPELGQKSFIWQTTDVKTAFSCAGLTMDKKSTNLMTGKYANYGLLDWSLGQFLEHSYPWVSITCIIKYDRSILQILAVILDDAEKKVKNKYPG